MSGSGLNRAIDDDDDDEVHEILLPPKLRTCSTINYNTITTFLPKSFVFVHITG